MKKIILFLITMAVAYNSNAQDKVTADHVNAKKKLTLKKQTVTELLNDTTAVVDSSALATWFAIKKLVTARVAAGGGGGGGGSIDTTSLSNRIELRLKIADSIAGGYYPYSTNPKGYLLPGDTASLSSRINLKVNKSDSVAGGYYPYSTNPKGYLLSETQNLNNILGIGNSSSLGMFLGADGLEVGALSVATIKDQGAVGGEIILREGTFGVGFTRIRSTSLNYTDGINYQNLVWPSTVGADHSIDIPALSGTLALTSQLPAALSGTSNTLTYWNSSNTIASLTTGTYPSLSEIAHVKGVTSAIQTQLNGKQASGSYLVAGNNLSDVSNVATARNTILPSKTGNSLKVLRVNSGETDYELATISAGGGDLLSSNNLSDVSSASTSRTNLGATAVGSNFFTLANPSAITYPRINADNTITPRTLAEVVTDLGVGATFRNPGSGDTLLTNPGTDSFLIKSLVAGTNITLVKTDTTITINSSGGGGTPGGSNGQVQYNNSSAFGGITGATTDGTKMTLVKPSINNIEGSYTTTATAAGTTTLTVTSTYLQRFSGATTQTCVLPDATTLPVGFQYQIVNNSTGIVTLNANGGGLVKSISAGQTVVVTVTDISSAAGVWNVSSSLVAGVDYPFKVKLGGDYTNATTTGTEITGLQITSTGTGILQFEFNLLVQSSATGTGWKFGVNHTGTATVLAINMAYPSTGTTAATGVGDGVIANNTGSIYEAAAAITTSTTAPNLGPTAGVATTGETVLVKVFGLLNVTASGDLEIWAGAETTGTITIKQNSTSTATIF